MAAVAAGIGAAEAVSAAVPLIEKGLAAANHELVGYHKTTYKYDAKGQLKETHSWNASLRAWELAALVFAGVAWETGVILTDAVKGTEEAARMMFDPIGEWVTEALDLIGKGLPTRPPPSLTAGQALNAQLALAIHTIGQVFQPVIVPTSERVAKSAQKYAGGLGKNG